MKQSSPYPKRHLPAAPCDDGGVLSRHQEKEQWLATLPSLGFELMTEDYFSTPEDNLALKRDIAAQKNRYGRSLRGVSRRKTQRWSQLWRHDAGVLVVVEQYRHGDASRWEFNNIDMFSRHDKGYGLGLLNSLGSSTTFGLSGEIISLNHTREGFLAAWEDIRKAASEGALVPISSWSQLPHVVANVLLNHQEIPARLPAVEATATPSDIWKMQQVVLLKSAARRATQRRRQLASLPLPHVEWEAWEWFLAQAAQKQADNRLSGNASDKKRKLPAWITRITSTPSIMAPSFKPAIIRAHARHQKACWNLHHLIGDREGSSGEPLTMKERATIKKWLGVIVDSRHPRHIDKEFLQASSSVLDRFDLHLHHLMFEIPYLPGIARKLLWWQSNIPSSELERLCLRPDHQGMSLPMHWMRAWMHTPSARVNPRAMKHRQAACQQALSSLASLVPCNEWVVQSAARSMWDGAMGDELSPSYDEDLIPPHQASVLSLMGFLDSIGMSPSTSIHIPGRPGPVSLLDPKALEAAIELAPGDFLARGSAVDRVAMLMPLIVQLQAVELGGRLTDRATSSVNRPRSRL